MLNIVETFRLGKRLLISPSVVLVLMIFFAGVSLFGLNRQKAAIDDIYNTRFKNYQQVADMYRQLASIHSNIYKATTWAAAQYDQAKVEALSREQARQLTLLTKTLQESVPASASPEAKKLYESALKNLVGYKKYAENSLEFLTVDVNTATMAVATADDKFQLIYNDFKELNDLQKEQAGRTYRDSLHGSRTMILVFIATLLAALGISLVVSFSMTRAIIFPIKQTIDILNDIAHGDLTRRLELSSANGGILAKLSQGVDAMTLSFREMVATVSASAQNVAAAAERLDDIAKRTASGTGKVARQTGSVASATEEMAQTSHEIAKSCQLAANAVQETNHAASAGSGIMQETIALMDEIASQVRLSADSVESLGAKSDQIGEIINTIQDIADQTNLLALNAAIEAARAGEQGRGFAVVADEVRALAERTTRATSQITDVIKSIQKETGSAVVLMEAGVGKVSNGTERAAKSGEALKTILAQIAETTAEIHQITTAAEQQTATTNQISSNMMEITEIINETANGAKLSADASSELHRLANEMQRSLGRFKLSC